MDNDGDNQWRYASLTLEEPRWPGTVGGQWVAATARSEEFRAATCSPRWTDSARKAGSW